MTFPFTPEGLVYRGLGKATGSALRTTTRTVPTTTTRTVPTTTTRTVPTTSIKKATGQTSNQPLRRSPRIAEKRKFAGAEQAGSGVSKKYKCGLRTHPSTPVGRKGQRFHVLDKANVRTKIGGREYSGHVLDRMQQRGITPSLVENTIKNGIKSKAKNIKRLIYFDLENNISVVTEDGNVITTCWGKFK